MINNDKKRMKKIKKNDKKIKIKECTKRFIKIIQNTINTSNVYNNFIFITCYGVITIKIKIKINIKLQ
jgi:hypothetical protein